MNKKSGRKHQLNRRNRPKREKGMKKKKKGVEFSGSRAFRADPILVFLFSLGRIDDRLLHRTELNNQILDSSMTVTPYLLLVILLVVDNDDLGLLPTAQMDPILNHSSAQESMKRTYF